MRGFHLWLLLFIIFSMMPGLCQAQTNNSQDLYIFNNSLQQSQFQQLTQELRCLVCQNQTLADSSAPLANDLRTEIARMIRQGNTNQQIINYLVNRYGDFILYRPPLVKITYLLWLTPAVLLLLGLMILLFIIIQRQRRASTNL